VTKITGLETHDLRFPTSLSLDGSDAMNPDRDYSAAYVVLQTDVEGLEGHGLTFTIGRGNEICCAAIEALRRLVVGLELGWIRENPGRYWRHVTSDSQLRWIGPDKGAIHLATGAVVNAVWDLLAKQSGKPVWRLVADMSPEEIVDIIDFRYLTDAINRDEALEILKRAESGKAERIARLEQSGCPCYTTSAGWLGYPDDKLRRLCREAISPIRVATGEMCQNRIIFKQMIMGGAIDVVQIDACRMGGLNEVLAVLLMAAKFGLPVWPHAGGVGLCEYVQHLSMIDFVAISGTMDGRVIEYVDHLHEHFIDPCVIRNAAYMPPTSPGFSIEMKPSSIAQYTFTPSQAAVA